MVPPLINSSDTAYLLRTSSSCHDPTILELLLEAGLGLEPSDNTIGPIIPTASATISKAKGIIPRSNPATQSKGWTALHTAAAAGTYDTLLRLLQQIRGGDGGGELDCRDCDGRTPLHLATSKGYMRCVSALVDGGVDKNARSKDGRTALHRAAANGDHEMVALLLDVGADPTTVTSRGRTPLDVARDKGHVRSSLGFPLNLIYFIFLYRIRIRILTLSKYKQKEVVEILERGELVLTAARRGDIQRLESLLKKGVSTGSHDQYGITALHSAAIKGHNDIVRLLVKSGMGLECRDVEGHTPLHLGVEGGWLEIVVMLVNMGADVNAKSSRGGTPLYMARSMGYDDISTFLVSRGATSEGGASSSSMSSM